MKRIFLLTVLYTLFAVSLAMAQQVEIIHLKGKVRVKKDAVAKWEKAAVGDLLEAQAEIKTGSRAQCVIAFGHKRRNVMTIEEKTRIKVEQVVPGSVFLPKGRVFTLIKELGEGEIFEVRTPTAVAGARGTGWITEFTRGITSISVFDDNVFVAGLDENGLTVTEFDVREDFRTEVHLGGIQRDIEPVTQEDRREWDGQARELEQIVHPHDFHPPSGDSTMDHKPSQEEIDAMMEQMKATGQFTEEELQKMQQMMESDFENMTQEEMEEMHQMMEAGFASMTEEERREMMEMMDGPYEQDPNMESMMQEMKDREGELMEMSPEEREAAMKDMEERYGVEGFMNEGGYPDQGAFEQYMKDQGFTSTEGQMMVDPVTGETYYYSGDMYFGEYDQAWDSDAGMYGQDYFGDYYDEYYQSIIDGEAECHCPSDCSLPPEICPDFMGGS